MDQWEAQVLARVLCKAGCIVVTEEKNRTMIEDMHMDWAPDVNTALAKATQVLGKNVHSICGAGRCGSNRRTMILRENREEQEDGLCKRVSPFTWRVER